jgi:RNA polymerase sigma-70 factor (ECF subfamily)
MAGLWASECLQTPVAETRQEFQAAIKPLLPRLYRFCLALCRDPAEAEDVLQEGLVRAYLHRESFEGRSSRLTWLRSIVRNHFIEHRRAQSRRASLWDIVVSGCTSALGSLFTGGAETLDPESEASSAQQRDRLHQCLHQLPETFRLVVFLCEVEELSYEDIASSLGLPVGTVKSRHFRGRERLSQIFLEVEAQEMRGHRWGGAS